jgi:hypothetical protein
MVRTRVVLHQVLVGQLVPMHVSRARLWDVTHRGGCLILHPGNLNLILNCRYLLLEFFLTLLGYLGDGKGLRVVTGEQVLGDMRSFILVYQQGIIYGLYHESSLVLVVYHAC